MTVKNRIHHLLDGEQHQSSLANWLRAALGLLILLNVAAVVLETEPSIHAWSPGFFRIFETISVAIFSIEYLLRLWVATEHAGFHHPVTGRLRWMVTPAALVDLIAILPWWLPETLFDLRSVRLLRLLRIIRIAKLGRYSVAIQTLQNVVRAKAADLVSLLFVLAMLLIVSSTLMYYFEHQVQPGAFASIPATMWWGIVTLTTVGYGDMTPMTGAGRVLGAFIAIMGIGMFALPAGLLGAAFVDELGKAKEARKARSAAGHGPSCPHCGKHLG